MTVVVDYEAGNLRSVETALRHLGAAFRISASPEDVVTADRVIVPGVGDARAAMERLDEARLSDAIRSAATAGRPLLGICLGSQIVLDRSEENDARCLGLISGVARAFELRPGRKIPHMGWNTVEPRSDHPLFRGISRETSFYFVHSYYPEPRDSDACLATCDYDGEFCAVLGRDTVVATQFHPEKSGEPGLRMLDNFLQWNP